MKILKTILLVLLLALILLIVFKNAVVKAVVEKGVEVATGLPLTIERLDLSLTQTTIDIEGLKLYNPKSFEEEIMLDVPKVYLAVDLPAFFKGELHVPGIRIYLDEFNVVKGEDGKLNLDALKPAQPATKEAPAPQKKQEPQEAMPMQIDLFELKVGQVHYIDYSRGGEKPFTQTFNIGIHEQFKNVDDINSIVRIIVVKALAGTTIGQLTNFDVSGLANTVAGTLSTSTEAVSAEAMKAWGAATETAGKTITDAQKLLDDPTKAAEGARDVLKGTTSEAKEAATALTDKTKDMAADLKEKIKLPFGKPSE